MTGYKDGYWWSPDGLRLHYRDYARDAAHPDDGRPPLLCLPGLTRNARDFEPLAARLAGEWRLICPDMRGRAESAYAKDAMTYVPLTYLQDISRLLADLAITRFVAIGTSLGGVITMLIAATHREWLAGALLNDVGPALDAAGLDRIRAYVGVGQSHPTWVHAARALAEANGDVYPGYGLEYDMKIAEPIRAMGSEAGVDMWPVMQAFSGIPTLLLRGARSDLLSEDNASRMAREMGESAELVTVPGVGHAPTLDEPESVAAIDRLLDRVLRG